MSLIRALFPVALLFALLSGAVGCVTEPVRLSDGTEGFVVTCKRTLDRCEKRAHKLCPTGFDQVGKDVQSGDRFTREIRCKEDRNQPAVVDRVSLGADLSEDKPDSGKGVEIEAIRMMSPAEYAGLEKGDVIVQAGGVAVNSPKELEDVVRVASKGSGSKLQLKVCDDDGEDCREVFADLRGASSP